MKSLTTICFALVAVLCGNMASAFAETPVSKAAPPPNIIVILTDDHGWADLGAQGVDPHIRTPNVDRLAADGVRFPRGYVTAPQCTPSRAGLISGQYQSKIGLEQNGQILRSEVVTLPERLKAAGYLTGISGKWHLDVEDRDTPGGREKIHHRDLLPHRQGFDEYFTGFMNDYTASHALDGTPYPDAPRDVTEPGCRVVLQTEWALQFLKRREQESANREPKTANQKPFFLYLAYMAPHTPLEFPEPFISQVPKDLPRERRSALALIAAIDDGVGSVRSQLRDMGQEENTLIFYLGDNGAPLNSKDPAKRRIWDGSINLPMHGAKGMLSEGGIRVPFLAAWPGRIPAGQVFPHPVMSLDIAATSVALAGLPHPPELDGVNLLPHLTGETKNPPHDTLYWRWVDQAAIQEFPHKLILPGGGEPLLFDITEPENETFERDLSARHPEIVTRLRNKLEAWMTTLNPPGPPEPLASHRAENFVEHAILPASAAPPKPAADAPAAGESFEGWSARNGTLVKQGDFLALQPEFEKQRGPRAYLSNSQLTLSGPATATLRLRAEQGGASQIFWRSRGSGASGESSADFQWPAGGEFQTVQIELPEAGRITHLRIMPPKNARGLQIQTIEFKGKTGAAKSLDLRPTKP